jgi:hypothetical protein
LLVKLHDAGAKGEHESLWRRSHLKSVGRVMSKEERLLPKIDYYIDESDPDIVILRRQDGTFVAAFSARGATMEGILEAAKEDYWRLIEANADLLDLRGDGDRKRSA